MPLGRHVARLRHLLDRLTHEEFEGRIGETFAAVAEGRTLTLTLRQVDMLPRPEGDKGRAPFSLEFTDPEPAHVPQQTVEVTHEELGTFPLFVVPLGPSSDGMRYEAVFT
ncbi:MAG TPA: hypothetical protein VF529_08325 [Solirubrobacteraceae bacterium]